MSEFFYYTKDTSRFDDLKKDVIFEKYISDLSNALENFRTDLIVEIGLESVLSQAKPYLDLKARKAEKIQEVQAQKQLEEAKQELRVLRININHIIQNEFANPSSAFVKSLSPEEKERLQFVVSFTKGNPIITQMNLKDVESVRSKLALNNQGTPSIIVRCQELQAQKQLEESQQKLREVRGKIIPLIENEFSDPSSTLGIVTK